MMKKMVHETILEIIKEEPIQTQQQLVELLTQQGVSCSQATLSRELRELGVVKQRDESGIWRYLPGQRKSVKDIRETLKGISRLSVISIKLADYLIVIKTIPGLAPAVASFIDKLNLSDTVGTLAGDDTAFIAMKDGAAAEELYEEISEILHEQ